jgi:hypothetical protein
MKRFLAVSTLTALLATYSFARLTRALRLSAQAYDIGLVFFWLWCILIGYFIARSTFLPRTIGVLYALAGLGLPDPSVAAAGKISVSRQSGPRRPRRNLAVAVAPREGSDVPKWKEEASGLTSRCG